MDSEIEKERNNRKRKGMGPAPVLYKDEKKIEKKTLNEDLPLEKFIRKVVHSHQVIVKAFRLLDLQDSLHMLRSSDVVLLLENGKRDCDG